MEATSASSLSPWSLSTDMCSISDVDYNSSKLRNFTNPTRLKTGSEKKSKNRNTKKPRRLKTKILNRMIAWNRSQPQSENGCIDPGCSGSRLQFFGIFLDDVIWFKCNSISILLWCGNHRNTHSIIKFMLSCNIWVYGRVQAIKQNMRYF